MNSDETWKDGYDTGYKECLVHLREAEAEIERLTQERDGAVFLRGLADAGADNWRKRAEQRAEAAWLRDGLRRIDRLAGEHDGVNEDAFEAITDITRPFLLAEDGAAQRTTADVIADMDRDSGFDGGAA